MATFRLVSFGCRASQADGAALKRQLLDAGLKASAKVEEISIAVLNTCTVTAAADAELRQVVRRIHRANPECRILVTGCYAQRAPAEIAALPGVAWVVGNSHKHAIAELLGRAAVRAEALTLHGFQARPDAESSPRNRLVQIGEPGAPISQGAETLVGEISDEFHFAPAFPDDRTRPTLKIQDGCNARCSFCVIPDVRGPSRSLAPERVIEEVRALVDHGCQEAVVSGINLGSYGKDLDRRITLLGLIERILDETSIRRLRLSSIEPMDVSQELIRLAARQPRLARHFHVPLQSGSDRILRLMSRRYWTTQYAERILAIHEQVPGCGIGADVMVGFPGETAEDHEASLRFIESLPFTYLHVFPYSARPGTPAGGLASQVTGRIIHERGRDMRSLIRRKRGAFLRAQVGRTLSALTLDDTVDGAPVALSSNYVKVLLPSSDVRPNTLLDLSVGRAGVSRGGSAAA
jgi:threonylcarbamoyladenosine tRNA methylthiotransferase MtaB